jgi:hypothetical protein
MIGRLHRRNQQNAERLVEHIFSLLDDLEDEAFDLGDGRTSPSRPTSRGYVARIDRSVDTSRASRRSTLPLSTRTGEALCGVEDARPKLDG